MKYVLKEDIEKILMNACELILRANDDYIRQADKILKDNRIFWSENAHKQFKEILEKSYECVDASQAIIKFLESIR